MSLINSVERSLKHESLNEFSLRFKDRLESLMSLFNAVER